MRELEGCGVFGAVPSRPEAGWAGREQRPRFLSRVGVGHGPPPGCALGPVPSLSPAV